jgi:hypothetical protein
MHVSVRTNLSVADNAKSAVLLHVSTSSKGQDGGKKDKTVEEKNKTTNPKII